MMVSNNEVSNMDSQVSQMTLGLLPERRTPWYSFVFGYGAQLLVLAYFVLAAIVYPEVLESPVHDYSVISLVATPPPVAKTPAPVRQFPTPKIAEMVTPRPDALRVPSEVVRMKKSIPDEPAPTVTMAAKRDILPEMKAPIPRPPVRTNVFSAGSSATPTLAAAPQKVQTGGFGDPNGLPAAGENRGRPVTIARAGSFDLPVGPGYGNGTGGSRGVRGVVASTGFGNGVATGKNPGSVSGSRGAVHQGGFGDADIMVAAVQPKQRSSELTVKTVPAEITYKPRPEYTDEGKRLKVEGEVQLDVVFSATGQIRILKVLQGLGHGLDESAIRAAEKIKFKPALQDGRPTDYEAVLHVTFQLAS
jgi:TonB family protein